jgi:tryptophan synthase beta subunit
MVPVLIGPAADTDTVKTGRRVTVSFWATEGGTVTVSAGEGENRVTQATRVKAGEGTAALAAALPPGRYTAEAVLTREDGTASEPFRFPLTVTEAGAAYTPLSPEKITNSGTALDGWTVPMDITDEEAVQAFEYLSRVEGIIPAIESSHAIAHAMKLAPQLDKDKIIVVTVSGRGDKDCAAIARYRGEDIHE